MCKDGVRDSRKLGKAVMLSTRSVRERQDAEVGPGRPKKTLRMIPRGGTTYEYEMALRRQALYESVDAAEKRLASGQGVAGSSALAEIRARHGL